VRMHGGLCARIHSVSSIQVSSARHAFAAQKLLARLQELEQALIKSIAADGAPSPKTWKRRKARKAVSEAIAKASKASEAEKKAALLVGETLDAIWQNEVRLRG
jgi:hypothetical protein